MAEKCDVSGRLGGLHATTPDGKEFEDDELTLTEDWRTFRARLIDIERGMTTKEGESWAHQLTTVEPGALLIATTEAFPPERGSQSYFIKNVFR